MAGKGPPPTPTAILKARGSQLLKKRRGEPHPPPATVEPPPWLEGDALAAWQELAPVLRGMRVLSEADTNALARYCTLWAEWKTSWKAQERLSRKKKLDTEELKALLSAGRLLTAMSAELLKLEQQFGLTPSSRSRLTTNGNEDEEKKAKPAPVLRLA